MPENPFGLPDPEIIAAPVQPEAAIAFWAWKSATPYDVVKRMDEGARQRAFYVTALAERDAVQAVKDALAKALENGETLKDFQERIAAEIERQGWKGHRVETVFRNNLQTAYSAGRYAKMRQVKKARPYWQYITVGDERVRPGHAILNGRVFPADHEFWGTNYPPNGHKCRCGVRSLSARQVEREGLTVETETPGDSIWTDPKTGMEYHVARPGADVGWRNNPGMTWVESTGKAPGAGGVSGPATGLPLDKHPDLTPQSYAEQRLRPAPVNTFADLAQGITNKCGVFVRNSQGITAVSEVSKSYFMATNGHGRITISNRSFSTPKGAFKPSAQLKDAWNKLANGQALDWLEEYGVESLWHEITHNRQKWASLGRGDTAKRRIMEIVTQWTSRRTYPELLAALGGKAAHQASIKTGGLGYGGYIKSFDRVLAALRVDEAALLLQMKTLIDTAPVNTYPALLSEWLAKESGRKKSAVKQALEHIGKYDFEDKLQKL
ncbi:MAG: phage head morphogenesis protein [Desulfovibrio sp.]|jgi:SPP1 gp7 family putative phage head morphogenesis protein|nr:phage head morphogenesis protein [Desulfovibrio sp.]